MYGSRHNGHKLILIAVKTPNDRDFFDFVGERFRPLYVGSG